MFFNKCSIGDIDEENLDEEDINILTYAAHLKEGTNEAKIVYLVSTDYHFSEIHLEGTLGKLVPELINQRFHVNCLHPRNLLKELLTIKPSSNK